MAFNQPILKSEQFELFVLGSVCEIQCIKIVLFGIISVPQAASEGLQWRHCMGRNSLSLSSCLESCQSRCGHR